MAMTLKAARVNKGLTQAQAADKLGVSIDTIRKYEAGVTFPNVKTIKMIEKLYGIGYNDIDFSFAEK